MEMIMENVWERTGRNVISRHQFNLLFGGFVLFGCFICAIGGNSGMHFFHPIPTGAQLWIPFLAAIVVAFLGCFLVMLADSKAVKLLGFSMSAFALGFIMGPLLIAVTAGSIVKALMITVLLVVVMSFIGATIPDSLEHWEGYLFGGLCVLVAGQFALPLLGWLVPSLPVKGALNLLDWFALLLFSAYVLYDVNRAQHVPATPANAIECAFAVFLDGLNIFIRILENMDLSELGSSGDNDADGSWGGDGGDLSD
jgi:FtsH-binding integral membrane protein